MLQSKCILGHCSTVFNFNGYNVENHSLCKGIVNLTELKKGYI